MHAQELRRLSSVAVRPSGQGGQVVKSVRPAGPNPNRLNVRPVVRDRWGFGSLADADAGRVIEPREEKGPSPILLFFAGFLGWKLLG